ncbi:MAG: MFS transporter, partial [Alphaproteobacteria bacterium]|nr:MFS transporter [Alphaproteobacteria bacterium]
MNKILPGLGLRIVAAEALDAILTRKCNADEAIAEASRKRGLEDRDHAFAVQIVLTTLRRMGEIDAILGERLSRPLPRKSGLALPILSCAVAQLLFLDTPAYAAIDLAVEAARADRNARHFTGVINAVLRKVSASRCDVLGSEESSASNTPAWLWKRWIRQYGLETAQKIAEAHLSEPQTDIVVKYEAKEWAERLGGTQLLGEHIRLPRLAAPVSALPGFDSGGWWVQDFAAGLPVKLLGSVRGKRVADLCAAPGGKTLQLCCAGAEVTAVDSSAARLDRLRQNLLRTGCEANVVCVDALKFEGQEDFDGVILDAPCSATGTIRRHPELPFVKSERDISQLVKVQARLLDHAANLVKLDGVLVYCTRSLEREEGEQQIEEFLERRGDFS